MGIKEGRKMGGNRRKRKICTGKGEEKGRKELEKKKKVMNK